MLCNECNECEATIHLTQVIGEVTNRRDLCEVCASDLLGGVSIERWAQRANRPLGSQDAVLDGVVAYDSRYPRAAYFFVLRAIQEAFTKNFQHISGVEVLEVLRLQAIDAFGKDAKSVLQSWGISSCEDFGEIVFNLVEGDRKSTRLNSSHP